MDNKKIIATTTVANTIGLALYDINDEQALVGVNKKEPEWVDIKWDSENGPYISMFGKTYIDNFIKVN